jgi:hypothetical protein
MPSKFLGMTGFAGFSGMTPETLNQVMRRTEALLGIRLEDDSMTAKSAENLDDPIDNGGPSSWGPDGKAYPTPVVTTHNWGPDGNGYPEPPVTVHGWHPEGGKYPSPEDLHEDEDENDRKDDNKGEDEQEPTEKDNKKSYSGERAAQSGPPDIEDRGSAASEEAKKMGLEFMGWGKYGKGGKVTHQSRDGKLVPVKGSTSTKDPHVSKVGGQDHRLQLDPKTGATVLAPVHKQLEPGTGPVKAGIKTNDPEYTRQQVAKMTPGEREARRKKLEKMGQGEFPGEPPMTRDAQGKLVPLTPKTKMDAVQQLSKKHDPRSVAQVLLSKKDQITNALANPQKWAPFSPEDEVAIAKHIASRPSDPDPNNAKIDLAIKKLLILPSVQGSVNKLKAQLEQHTNEMTAEAFKAVERRLATLIFAFKISQALQESNSLTVKELKQLVKEERVKLETEVATETKTIEKKLEEVRTEMFKDYLTMTKEGAVMDPDAGVKNVQLSTVSEMIDVPVNELMLYFLNNTKLTNEYSTRNPCSVEYHLGHVIFRAF